LEAAVPTGRDRARLEHADGQGYRIGGGASYSLSLRVTSIPPPRWVTRL